MTIPRPMGEIGGSAEVDAACWVKENRKKPIAAFIAECGIAVSETPADMAVTLLKHMGKL